MNELPINISNIPVKAAAAKPSGKDNVAQQDAGGFGNVLARQVEDSAKPAEPAPPSSGDSAKQAGEQDKAKIASADITSSLPADMLAALLAQQNPAVTVQPEIINQAVTTAQTAVVAFVASGASDKKASASLALVSADGHPSNTATAALDSGLPKVEISAKDNKSPADTVKELDARELSPAKDSNGFSGLFKAAGMRELNSPGNSQMMPGAVIGDLATSAQQPALPPLLHGTPAPSSAISISTPVTQAAWGDEFSQKITWIATQHHQSAELHLNPPQLGPLDVVLKISGDQASATFTSPHAAVRDAIEQALPKLREMLADNGITLGNAMVSDQASKNGQDNAPHKPQRGMPISVSEGATEAARIHETRVSSISRHNGMVDTFA